MGALVSSRKSITRCPHIKGHVLRGGMKSYIRELTPKKPIFYDTRGGPGRGGHVKLYNSIVNT